MYPPQNRIRTLDRGFETIPGLVRDPVLVNILKPEPLPILRQATTPRRTRVVITGLGAITPVGNSAETFWQNLLAGVSGIGPLTVFDGAAFPSRIAGEVRGFDASKYMDFKEARRMARCSQYGLAAARMAWADAGLEDRRIDTDRTGVLMGTAVGGYDSAEAGIKAMTLRGPSKISPFAIGAAMPNATSFHISLAFGLHGYNATVTTACAAGTQAIAEAAEIIRRGTVDTMVAGGTEAGVIEVAFAGFGQMRALSTRNEAPAHASRPFDGERDGLVLGDGAGVVILESLEHAQARGAHIYAEVLGSGISADAYHIAAPDPRGGGARRAMEWALHDAHITPDEIDYINAHATSTLAGDEAEVMAVKKVFGDRAGQVPISATKSMIGHTIGAAGGLEAIVCALTLRDQKIHPTINQTTPDPACDLDFVPNAARAARVETILSNSFGLGGQNACLVLRKFSG